MKTQAAILVETGNQLVLSEIDIPQLKPGQVLVDIAYSGVCHTQVLECLGHRGEDKYLPHCLGHEAARRTPTFNWPPSPNRVCGHMDSRGNGGQSDDRRRTRSDVGD